MTTDTRLDNALDALLTLCDAKYAEHEAEKVRAAIQRKQQQPVQRYWWEERE